MADTPRPSLRAFFANWRESDRPFFEKLRMSAGNTATKVRKRANCCGNHGEPGCCLVENCEVPAPDR